MEQVIVGGLAFNDLDTSTTLRYSPIMGAAGLWNNLEASCYNVIPTGGKLESLYVKLAAAPGVGKSYTFTLRLNGEDTSLACTVSDEDTAGSDVVHEVAVVAGDLVTLKCVAADTPTATSAIWSMKFDGTNTKESVLLGSTVNSLNPSATEYQYVATGNGVFAVTETNRREVIPTTGKLKNFYVKLNADPGTAPDAYKFTLRVNGANSDDGEGNPLQVTITANDTTGSDTTHEITVVAGDIVTLMVEPLNVPSASPIPSWGMCFVADTDGESIILNGDADNLNVTTTEYHSLCALDLAWTATEADIIQLGQTCTMKKLYALLSGAPGDGKSYVFNLRAGATAGATSLVVTISGAVDTTGNDTAHEVAISDGDEVALENNPDGTPTVRDAYWGLVCYIEPAAVTFIPTVAII